MKICMYNVTTAEKIGGIETYNWEVSKVLQEMGHNIEIVSGTGNRIKYNDIKNIQFDYTPRDSFIDLGNRFRAWSERVSFFKNAYKYLKQQRYDIFIIHKPFDFFVCYFIKKFSPKTKTVFVSGGEDFYGFDKFFVKYVDFIFAVSKANSRKIIKRYKREIKVIPNGVDIDKFKPSLKAKEKIKKQLNLEDKKVLLSVGRIVGWKGFQLVIETLTKLDDFYYILIGNGENLKELKTLAKDLNVDDRVIFLGSIDNQILPQFFNIADIFIQPSIGHEAFGITIVEALACGIPVVASRNGGIVDIVENSNCGYLFETNNKIDMIEKINLCYDNRRKLSKQAPLHVEQNFTWKSCVNRILEEIKQ